MKPEKIAHLSIFTIFLACLVNFSHKAQAQGRYLNITIDGSHSRTFSTYKSNTRQSVSAQFGFPIADYFEFSVAHTLLKETTVYNKAYEKLLTEKGNTIPPGGIMQKSESQDTSVNGGVGILIGSMRPSIFAGRLWRLSCQEDSYEDLGCATDQTWNAGAALSIYLTQRLSFRLSYRISPSSKEGSDKKSYDDLTSVGLTWGI